MMSWLDKIREAGEDLHRTASDDTSGDQPESSRLRQRSRIYPESMRSQPERLDSRLEGFEAMEVQDDIHREIASPGDILEMMARGGEMMARGSATPAESEGGMNIVEQPRNHALDETRRKPIVSINGHDVDDWDVERPAA